MTLKTRPATLDDLMSDRQFQFALRWDRSISYRHFVREFYSPRAKNGVSHRQRSRSKIYMVSGVPHVRHQKELRELTGTVMETDTVTCVADFRIASQYL